jgi:endoglucanase
VTQGTTSITITVNRSSGSSGAITVAYATVNGTAVAGTAYTATSGTLSWASGDATAKTFAVTISNSPAFSGTEAFSVQLSGATGGAALATPSSATVSIQGSAPASGGGSTTPGGPTAVNLNNSLPAIGAGVPYPAPTNAPVVKVSGNKLVNAAGNTVQLRGVDLSALEFNVIDNAQPPPGGNPFDYWGGQYPTFSALAAWKVHALRIPLNEQSYLNQTAYNPAASSTAPQIAELSDPLNSYRAVVKQIVDAATAAGMYVILDLHKNTSPGVVTGATTTPLQLLSNTSSQSTMADEANSPAFWTQVATDFQNYPNVIFDLFNEPHIDNFVTPANLPVISGQSQEEVAEWYIWLNGGMGQDIYGDNQFLVQPFPSAGMQQLVNSVRATGSTNVVMVGGVSWAQDESLWVQFVPSDPLGQLACSWHAYPSASNPTQPGFANNFVWAEAILAAGYPIIIGETGDESATGDTAQWLPTLLPWADANNVSVFAWTWNAWGAANDDLITSATGTPTSGEGQYYQTWLVNHQ